MEYHLFGKIGPGRFRHFDEENNELRINLFRELENLQEPLPRDEAHVMFSDLYVRKEDFVDHVIRPNPILLRAYERDNGYVKRKGRTRMSGPETRGRKPAHDVAVYLEAAIEVLKRDVPFSSWSKFYAEIRTVVANGRTERIEESCGEDGGPADDWFDRHVKRQLSENMPETVYRLLPQKKIAISAKINTLFVPRIFARAPIRQQIMQVVIGSRKTMSNSKKQAAPAGETFKVLSVNEAAAYLRVGRNTIYNLLNDGRLSRLETGFRRRLIKRCELDEIISGTR